MKTRYDDLATAFITIVFVVTMATMSVAAIAGLA